MFMRVLTVGGNVISAHSFLRNNLVQHVTGAAGSRQCFGQIFSLPTRSQMLAESDGFDGLRCVEAM